MSQNGSPNAASPQWTQPKKRWVEFVEVLNLDLMLLICPRGKRSGLVSHALLSWIPRSCILYTALWNLKSFIDKKSDEWQVQTCRGSRTSMPLVLTQRRAPHPCKPTPENGALAVKKWQQHLFVHQTWQSEGITSFKQPWDAFGTIQNKSCAQSVVNYSQSRDLFSTFCALGL